MLTRSIRPISAPLNTMVRLPGSKSLSHRALLTSALADGHSLLSNFLFADDTDHLLDGLAKLGIAIETDRAENRVEVRGCGGYWPAEDAELNCGDSGSMLRFLTALCATGTGRYRLYGSQRLHQRPVGPLVSVLQRMGALVEFEEQEGFAPLVVHGRGLKGGQYEVEGSQSSQFASGIILAGPLCRSDLLLALSDQAVSLPYVGMTIAAMEAFGVSVVSRDWRRVIVPAPQAYQACSFLIEPDATHASYFLASAAIAGGQIQIEGLGQASCQGDMTLCEILTRMGCEVHCGEKDIRAKRPETLGRLHRLEIDMGSCPDLVPTVAVLALFADGATRISRVPHLRIKESDRLMGLATQLNRLGAEVELHSDGLIIHPPAQIQPGVLETYNDHRLAMAFSLVGLVVDGIEIQNPGCISKSFPSFFETLESITH